MAEENFSHGSTTLKNVKEAKVLGVLIDNRLSFKNHIKNLCKTVSNKLNCLARLAKTLTKNQRVLLFNSFIKGQFNYCPLIWMFCSRRSHNSIDKLYERALRLAYDDFTTPSKNLYETYKVHSIHHTNIQILMIEVYKILNNLSPPLISDMFTLRTSNYSFRNFRELSTDSRSSVWMGTESLQFRAPQLWQSVPEETKKSPTLEIFKRRIKLWKPNNCQCRLCKIYIPNVGFI